MASYVQLSIVNIGKVIEVSIFFHHNCILDAYEKTIWEDFTQLNISHEILRYTVKMATL